MRRAAVKGRGVGVAAERTEECRDSVVQGTVPIAAAGVGVVAGGRAGCVGRSVHVKAIHATAFGDVHGECLQQVKNDVLQRFGSEFIFSIRWLCKLVCVVCACLPVPNIEQSLLVPVVVVFLKFAQEHKGCEIQ